MTPEQTHQLITLLKRKRQESGLSIYEVSRRAGLNRSVLSRIERGINTAPTADSLQAIGEVLGIPTTDLFTAVGWVTKSDLPSIRPYLRTKYRQLPESAVREIEEHFDALAKKHGISFDAEHGPTDREDE